MMCLLCSAQVGIMLIPLSYHVDPSTDPVLEPPHTCGPKPCLHPLCAQSGNCGGCWAFGSIAAVESAYLILYPGADSFLVDLSEQQIVE